MKNHSLKAEAVRSSSNFSVVEGAFPSPLQILRQDTDVQDVEGKHDESWENEVVSKVLSSSHHTIVTHAFDDLTSMKESLTKIIPQVKDEIFASYEAKAMPLVFPELQAESSLSRLMRYHDVIYREVIESGINIDQLKRAMVDSDYSIEVAKTHVIHDILTTYEKSFSGPPFYREYSHEKLRSLWRSSVQYYTSLITVPKKQCT
jgi:hypothetical protein